MQALTWQRKQWRQCDLLHIEWGLEHQFKIFQAHGCTKTSDAVGQTIRCFNARVCTSPFLVSWFFFKAKALNTGRQHVSQVWLLQNPTCLARGMCIDSAMKFDWRMQPGCTKLLSGPKCGGCPRIADILFSVSNINCHLTAYYTLLRFAKNHWSSPLTVV